MEYKKLIGILIKNPLKRLKPISQNVVCVFTHRRAKAGKPCPTPSELPAITAILSDPQLFSALIACLKPPAPTETNEAAPTGGRLSGRPVVRVGGGGSVVGLANRMGRPGGSSSSGLVHSASSGSLVGRKRSLSLASENDSMPQQQQQSFKSPKLVSASPKPKPSNSQLQLQIQGGGVSTKQELFNTRIVAAALLMAALHHLDHWPAPLMEAYAQDAFGPRLWVDRDECAHLVQNLALCHDTSNSSKPTTTTETMKLQEAELVATYYTNLLKNGSVVDKDDENDTHATTTTTTIAEESDLWFSSSPQKKNLRHPPPRIKTTTTTTTQSLPNTIERTASVDKNATYEPNDDDSSDSDSSGDEEIVEVSTGTAQQQQQPKANESKPATAALNADGSSSSSGEEEVVMADSFDNNNTNGGRNPPYPIRPTTLNLTRIRPRYCGVNRDMAFEYIGMALQERLSTRTKKQNSRLLQCLPTFCTVPRVRSLVALFLERWLQSPALSGAARTLFAVLVRHMRCVKDPPLSDDLQATDSILSMQLKANQLNVHIENITAIARNMPTATVSQHIFLQLLRKELEQQSRMGSAGGGAKQSDYLRMVAAVHGVLSIELSSEGMATAILTLLAKPPASLQQEGPIDPQAARTRLVRRLRLVIRQVVATLGASFDACRLIDSLLSFTGGDDWSVQDEEDKGRILLECITWLVPPRRPPDPVRGGKQANRKTMAAPQRNDEELRQKLSKARTMLLDWCCSDYAPLWQSQQAIVEKRQAQRKRRKKEEAVVGAGPPDFGSALDCKTPQKNELSSSCPRVMQCLLFMTEPRKIQAFLHHLPDGEEKSPSLGDNAEDDEFYRIQECYSFGADVDDEMLWRILRSVENNGIGQALALKLVENLFACCQQGRNKARLIVSDPQLVWKLYNLVEYKPPPNAFKKPAVAQKAEDQFADAEEDDEMEIENGRTNGIKKNGISKPAIPRLVPLFICLFRLDRNLLTRCRLAYPGHWWRVTMLALVMCGVAPKEIAAKVFPEHPTLLGLLKMVTSGRYRFPTVDCDDKERELVKKGESDIRNRVRARLGNVSSRMHIRQLTNFLCRNPKLVRNFSCRQHHCHRNIPRMTSNRRHLRDQEPLRDSGGDRNEI